MTGVEQALHRFVGALWSPGLAVLVLVVGLLLTIATLGIQIRGLPLAWRLRKLPEGRALAWAALASSTGMGSLAGVTLAISASGPGAVLWVWVIALLGMAFQFSETALAVKYRGEGRVSPMAYMRAGLGTAGRWFAFVFAGLATLLALVGGGVFQAQQAAAVLHHGGKVMPWATAAALAALSLPFVFTDKRRRFAIHLGAVVAFGIIVLAMAAVAMNKDRVGEALRSIFTGGFSMDAIMGGMAGGTLMLVVQHGMARALLAGEAGLGGSALIPELDRLDSPKSAGALTMVFGLVNVGGIGTLLALLVLTSPAHEALTEHKVVPLERHESRGLRPSARGQTIVLVADTKLEAGNSYDMVLRANPRGHKVGRIGAEGSAHALPNWEIAASADTLVFRSTREHQKDNPAFDLRIATDHTVITIRDQKLVRLDPWDETIDLEALAKDPLWDGPYVVLDDFEFVGVVAEAISPDPELGEHLAMFQAPRDDDAPDNPILRTIFALGYRGPYVKNDEPTPPWVLVGKEGWAQPIGEVVHMRMQAPVRGLEIGSLDPEGRLIVPAWDFLARSRYAVLRHERDAHLDMRVPIDIQYENDRLIITSARSDIVDFRRAAKMIDYSGPYLDSPFFEFEVEVRTDTRLPPAWTNRRALIPHTEQSFGAHEPRDAPYDPHPAEVLSSNMKGPFLAIEGTAALTVAVEGSLGEVGRWAFVVLVLLSAFTTIVLHCGHGVHVACDWLGSGAGAAFRGTFVIATALGGLLTLGFVLAVVDSLVALLLICNLLTLLLLLPKVRQISKDTT